MAYSILTFSLASTLVPLALSNTVRAYAVTKHLGQQLMQPAQAYKCLELAEIV